MKIDVKHVAKLANLPISSVEQKKFEKQLEETIDYVQELNKIDEKNVEPTSHVTGLENVTREDTPSSDRTLSQEEALSNAKTRQGNFFKTKGIFNE